MRSPIAQLLEDKFREWGVSEINKGHKRITITSYAKWLGFTQSAVSNWMSDNRTPDGESIPQLAEKLGYEVYDALNLPRPDHRIAEIKTAYNTLPPEAKNELYNLVIEYARLHTPEDVNP